MVHPRDRREINSRCGAVCMHVYTLLRGVGQRARGEDENGTVNGERERMDDDVDPRAIRVTVAVDRHEK